MTGDQQRENFFGRGWLSHWQAVGLTFIALTMPLLIRGFGWLYAIVPLPAFYYLAVEGEKKGLQIIGWAVLLTGAGAIIAQGLGIFLFTASFLAVSFSLTRSLRLRHDPTAAGIRACAALLTAWLIYAAGYGLLHKKNPYADLLAFVDHEVEAAYPVYLKSTELSDSLKQDITATFDAVRQTLPKIMPALLVLWLITTVWLTMTVGALLIRKRRPELMAWPPYRDWRLPDITVWAVIASGVMLFVPTTGVRLFGLNGLMVCAVLYFFQGLAVLGTLFNRWRVPPVVRILIYILTLMQMYGLLFLSVLGLIDVWADFKKPRGKATM
jgi:uncharacterized protein YybS (DUF2232 family)